MLEVPPPDTATDGMLPSQHLWQLLPRIGFQGHRSVHIRSKVRWCDKDMGPSD